MPFLPGLLGVPAWTWVMYFFSIASVIAEEIAPREMPASFISREYETVVTGSCGLPFLSHHPRVFRSM